MKSRICSKHCLTLMILVAVFLIPNFSHAVLKMINYQGIGAVVVGARRAHLVGELLFPVHALGAVRHAEAVLADIKSAS